MSWLKFLSDNTACKQSMVVNSITIFMTFKYNKLKNLFGFTKNKKLENKLLERIKMELNEIIKRINNCTIIFESVYTDKMNSLSKSD